MCGRKTEVFGENLVQCHLPAKGLYFICMWSWLKWPAFYWTGKHWINGQYKTNWTGNTLYMIFVGELCAAIKSFL